MFFCLFIRFASSEPVTVYVRDEFSSSSSDESENAISVSILDEENEDNENEIVKNAEHGESKNNALKIVTISRLEIIYTPNEFIEVTFNKKTDSNVFGRFDKRVVAGYLISNTKARFHVPYTTEKKVEFSISFDEKQWTEPVILFIEEKPSETKVSFVLFIFILAMFSYFTLKKMFIESEKRKPRINNSANKNHRVIVSHYDIDPVIRSRFVL